jgi:hypothetical protein
MLISAMHPSLGLVRMCRDHSGALETSEAHDNASKPLDPRGNALQLPLSTLACMHGDLRYAIVHGVNP